MKKEDRWRVVVRRKELAVTIRVAELLRELDYLHSRRKAVRNALILLGDEHVILREAMTKERSE